MAGSRVTSALGGTMYLLGTLFYIMGLLKYSPEISTSVSLPPGVTVVIGVAVPALAFAFLVYADRRRRRSRLTREQRATSAVRVKSASQLEVEPVIVTVQLPSPGPDRSEVLEFLEKEEWLGAIDAGTRELLAQLTQNRPSTWYTSIAPVYQIPRPRLEETISAMANDRELAALFRHKDGRVEPTQRSRSAAACLRKMAYVLGPRHPL